MKLYVCENCGRLGPIPAAFEDECRPGWTHGRLHRVEDVWPGIREEVESRIVREFFAGNDLADPEDRVTDEAILESMARDAAEIAVTALNQRRQEG